MKSRRLSETSKGTSDEAGKSPLAGELMDLYVAMVIVIPLAFFLKSLWP